jgi:hypothetical protein
VKVICLHDDFKALKSQKGGKGMAQFSQEYRLLQLEGNSASVGVLLLIAAVLENISVLTLAG